MPAMTLIALADMAFAGHGALFAAVT